MSTFEKHFLDVLSVIMVALPVAVIIAMLLDFRKSRRR